MKGAGIHLIGLSGNVGGGWRSSLDPLLGIGIPLNSFLCSKKSLSLFLSLSLSLSLSLRVRTLMEQEQGYLLMHRLPESVYLSPFCPPLSLSLCLFVPHPSLISTYAQSLCISLYSSVKLSTDFDRSLVNYKAINKIIHLGISWETKLYRMVGCVVVVHLVGRFGLLSYLKGIIPYQAYPNQTYPLSNLSEPDLSLIELIRTKLIPYRTYSNLTYPLSNVSQLDLSLIKLIL